MRVRIYLGFFHVHAAKLQYRIRRRAAKQEPVGPAAEILDDAELVMRFPPAQDDHKRLFRMFGEA